jgi:hypothetical protein
VVSKLDSIKNIECPKIKAGVNCTFSHQCEHTAFETSPHPEPRRPPFLLDRDSGRFLVSCPVDLIFHNPAVREAAVAHAWKTDGALSARYPAGVPLFLASAIESYEAGMNKAQHERLEEIRDK